MKKINRSMFFSVLVVLAYVLSACSGAPAGQSSNDQSSQSGQVQEVVFTGTVDSMGGGEWTISGQAVTVDGTTSVDANIAVGNNVKVEARVGQDGKVTAVRVELAGADDTNANSNDANQNDNNANDNTSNDNAASNSNDNQGDNSNSNSNNGNANDNSNNNDNSSAGDEQEVSGLVEAITTDSITINGVVYTLADFTEFNGIVALGDSVKIHAIVNADGTFTIREIEKTGGPGLGDGNSNSNGSDDNSNANSNSNGNDNNGNDDNGNDDNGNDDNGNDDNGNDDNGNDDNSNSNGNG